MTSTLPTPIKSKGRLIPASDAVQSALAAAPSVDISWVQPPPTDNGWTLAPDALRFVMALVERVAPRHILEMGAGLSTRALMRAARELKPVCAISSVDHDPEFGPLATQHVDFNPSSGGSGGSGAKGPRLKFQVAPVVVRDFGGKLLPVYHILPGKLASRRPADLVLIDGPPVNMGGREGTLYQAIELSRPGTLVLLDDANRDSERAAVAHWQETLGDAISVHRLPGFAKGMVAIVVNQVVRREDLWQRRLDFSRRDLEAVIPPGQRFILIDHPSLVDGLAPAPGRAIPFTEKNGEFWGAPENDAAALAELQRQRQAGMGFLVLAWSSFWWRECYPALFEHLRTTARLVLENDRLLVFDLRA